MPATGREPESVVDWRHAAGRYAWRAFLVVGLLSAAYADASVRGDDWFALAFGALAAFGILVALLRAGAVAEEVEQPPGNLLRTSRARRGVERGVLVGAGLVAGAFYFMGGLVGHEVAPLVIGVAVTLGAAAYGFHVWKRAEVGADA